MRRLTVTTATLSIACGEWGPAAGPAVLLLHGFPCDPQAYAEMAPVLAAAGRRVIVPYLRGYGPTRFLSADTMRSGQQAALAQDALDLMDALGIGRAIVSGFDWSGRAACVLAALAPDRVAGLVNAGGYVLQDIAAAGKPMAPDEGRRLWSPDWRWEDAVYGRSAGSFDNPDFVDVVIHSYRHRMGRAAGDPALQAMETAIAARPTVAVATITFDGASDAVDPPSSSTEHEAHFHRPL